ncbi:MAG TPA: hypothetical protein VFN31_02495 [Candidatus Saccharimonadales bacterium]|nr:hypothetical protein [Candidatus Saccharimonadales bacterium]
MLVYTKLMTTTDNVLLIILTSLLSILILVGIMIAIGVFNLIITVRRVVAKAETVVDSVESAAEVLADAKGRMAVFKLIRNIVRIARK